jgi:DNA mismatch repair protein MutS
VHLSAVEHKDRIVFLHAVQEGPASQSYGLQVAQLAGVPPAVIRSARRHLAQLEAQSTRSEGQFDLFSVQSLASEQEAGSAEPGTASSTAADPAATALAAAGNDMQLNTALLNALAEVDPDQLSPRDALDALYRLKRLADEANDDH